MHLKKTPNKETGRIYLSMVKSYWNKEKGYSSSKQIEKFGYIDDLKKEYDDPIAHFTKIVEERNRLDNEESMEYIIHVKKNQTLEKNTNNRKNYGYIVILKILSELGLDGFLNRRQRATKIEYCTSAIMKLLVVSRILSPGSKKRAYKEKGRYFDFESDKGFNLQNLYRSLSHFSRLSKDIQLLIHNRIKKHYTRKTDLIYYDVTNYYFEIDMEDNLRKNGFSKENRRSPIVQLGLSMDEEGLPISYEVFAGNESEKLHLRPIISELIRKYDTSKIIAVADSAQNTGNNIYFLDEARQGYVFSQSIRGGSKDFKEYVISEDNYKWYYRKDEEGKIRKKYKRKSRNCIKEISVDFIKDGKQYKKKIEVEQRQIVFYSEKYAARARKKREEAVKKAHKIITNPSAYTKATSYGALKYVKNVVVDKKTGELKESEGKPFFDYDQVLEDEKYDGYYSIVTNVYDEEVNKGKFDDDAIIGIYRGLWKIEDNFRVSKSDLKLRPIYLTREERIHSHFLICFIALVVTRLIQKRTRNRHSAAELIKAMNDISCSYEGENLFLFDHRSDVIDDLGETFGIDFTQQRLTRSEIKKRLGAAKKVKKT